MRRVRHGLVGGLAGLALLVFPAAAGAGHGINFLDHPAPAFDPLNPPSSTINSGGPGAEWELIETIATGNPHTDLDFFTQGGETYASVGTLGIGPNAGGQTIVKLTNGGDVDPQFVAGHPSASCLSDPSAATGLQHDVEAAPKGEAILNTPNEFAVRTDTQVLIDASDAEGRCHDQGVLGIEGAPNGGLEIVDVTDVANPVEIGLTSHIGESHTVNIDPKRPHIAYSVTSDAIAVNEEGQRENEIDGDNDAMDLDGFEVVDFSSCMNFPGGTTVEQKRDACDPEVYRYRFPTADMALGHTVKTGTSAIFGCHELEVYPDDRLTCGSGNALIALDMSGAFDDMGTPSDYSDDKPRGEPLPCTRRDSSSVGPFVTGAKVVDCVDGTGAGTTDLDVPTWLANGAPSLEGVEWLGSVHHQGGGPGQTTIPPFDSTQDIAFNHEAELTGSRRHLIATDERGGGIIPPGATCSPGADNVRGNGGVHFYNTNALTESGPGTPGQAHEAYALTPEGEKAIFRAQVRTVPQGAFCTAHVFQQIPGENRIFMGWYTQGTQVLDFVEHDDGTVSFESAGWMIPENANTWVSHIFKTEDNPDGSRTYYGATGDFTLAGAGRNSIDVYKVTLPPAPKAGTPGGGGGGGGGGGDKRCAQRVVGSKSGETLFGSIAGDRISGRAGKDKIKARGGDDCVRGGRGADKVKGGPGDDELRGNPGRDKVRGGAGDDKLRGNAGRDKIKGGTGNDVIRVKGGGRDKVRCGPGKDRVKAGKRDKVRGCEKQG